MNLNLVRLAGVLMIAGLLTGGPASPRSDGPVYVVNTTDNVLDVGPAPCDSRHCSLQEAVRMANSYPGPARITFDLPGDPPYIIFLGTPEGLTYMEMNIWDDETEIDGTSQPGWPIYLHGMGEAGWGMVIHSNRNTVRGLGFLGFTESGLDVHGEDNFIDRVVAGDYLGGGLIVGPIGNTTGIFLGGDNNTVRGASVGNNTTGIWTSGSGQQIEDCVIGSLSGSSSRRGNETGIRLNGSGNTVTRNTIIGNSKGIWALSDANVITRNWIGLDTTRTHALGNHVGIELFEQGGNRVGGTDAYEGNVIVDNNIGILVISPGNQILNNRIGVDYGGTAYPNAMGVYIEFPSDGNILGAGWSGAGNVIAFNTEGGVVVNTVTRVNILGNSIYRNGGHGIDLRVDYGAPPAEGMRIEISRNSIYDNGGQGIYIPVAAFNHDVSHPDGLRVDGVTVTGTACPGCTVELFEAARDPTGFGEGKTFLASVTAAADGSFTAEIPRLGACSQVTATATDELGNTSDFSLNANAVMCFRTTLLVAWIWVIGAGAAGAALLGGLGRRRPPVLAWVVVGGLLGIGLAAGSLYLPFVQVTRPGKPPSQEGPAGMLPPCSQFLDTAKLVPADGAVFQQGEDLIFGLSPQPDPPGSQTNWKLDVIGPRGNTASRAFSGESSFPLTSLGLDPDTTGSYYWKLSAERRTSNSDPWTPLCTDLGVRRFQIGQTGQGVPPIARLNQHANCRSGPGTDYPALDILAQGVSVPVIGRNQGSSLWQVFTEEDSRFLSTQASLQGDNLLADSWWQVMSPNLQRDCWLSGNVIDLSGDTSAVPVVQVAPPPAAVPSDTPVPPFNCGQYNANTCIVNNHPCKWENNACVNK